MHTLFNGLIKEKFVVLNFAEAFRLHTTRESHWGKQESYLHSGSQPKTPLKLLHKA